MVIINVVFIVATTIGLIVIILHDNTRNVTSLNVSPVPHQTIYKSYGYYCGSCPFLFAVGNFYLVSTHMIYQKYNYLNVSISTALTSYAVYALLCLLSILFTVNNCVF